MSRDQAIYIPGTIVLYEQMGLNETDNYQVQSDGTLYEGNLLLVDENFQVYTAFYLRQEADATWLSKGKDVPVKPLGKHQYSLLYFPYERDSEFLYDCYYGKRSIVPAGLEGIQIPLLDIREQKVEMVDLPLVIDFGSSNTTMGICRPDGSTSIANVNGTPIIPSIIGVKTTEGDKTEFLFGDDARALTEENYRDEDVAVFYDIKRWVSDADRSESVILQNGYKYQFERRKCCALIWSIFLIWRDSSSSATFRISRCLHPYARRRSSRHCSRSCFQNITLTVNWMKEWQCCSKALTG